MGWVSDVLAWFADPAHWRGPTGVPTLAVQHLGFTAAALGLACLLGLPLAVWLGHLGRGGVLAVQVSNIGRAVPTLALLVILVLMPAPFGRSLLSAIVAFTLFALPPVITNTYVGMRQVDRGAVEAARGMGMSGGQVLARVELPLATPLIMTGVRLAAVQLVATVAIAALAAFGGLGRIVTGGFAVQDVGAVVAGALVIAVLALAVELALERLTTAVDPRERARRASQRRVAGAAAAARAGAAADS
jgi:osmoprotectant transport system permease protein